MDFLQNYLMHLRELRRQSVQ